ncbi:MAG: dienelactone hydrolase family protein [Bacteroidota bacterium]
MIERMVQIMANGQTLDGNLVIPDTPKGLVIFSHGSGSSRKSPRNRMVAAILQRSGFATLLFDLLTPEEDANHQIRFDINLLSRRLITATQWIRNQRDYKHWSIGYFGASTGAASAIRAAAAFGPEVIQAVVSRGGRPDLVSETSLAKIESPTLLIVGERDIDVIKMNKSAYKKLTCEKDIILIPNATHLFEEPGTLSMVIDHAEDWFLKHLHWRKAEIDKDFMPDS